MPTVHVLVLYFILQLQKVEEKSETTTKEVDRIFQVLFNACYPEGKFMNLRHEIT